MDDKSIYFVHLPKTSGTSLNEFISSHYQAGECEIHFENSLRWGDAAILKSLVSKKFLSGHVRYPVFRNRMPSMPHVKFSMLREPVGQIASHLVWVRDLCEPIRRAEFDRHPEYIQRIAIRLADIDFRRPAEIGDFFATMSKHERDLFDNCQTRYFLPNLPSERIVARYLAQALRNLDQLDVVGVTDRYQQTVVVLCQHMGWAVPGRPVKLNVTRSRHSLDWTNPKIVDVLSEVTRFDQVLYEHARDRLMDDFYRIVRQIDLESGTPEALLQLDAIGKHVSAGAVAGPLQHVAMSPAGASPSPGTRTRK